MTSDHISPVGADEPEAVGSTPLTILAVDDDPLTLHALQRLLERQSYRVLRADNGDDGLALALGQSPHLLITDWHMGGLNGLGLCRALRASALGERLYIIMLTACETDDELVQAFGAGADDYVVKPFTPKVLEARIRGGERLVRQQMRIEEDKRVIQDYAERLARSNRRLERMATTDALTGLPNRRYALDNMPRALAESRGLAGGLACLMLDVDHFKRINDSHGHDGGDLVLCEVARTIETHARQGDTVSRIGGEELLIYGGGLGADEAEHFAERLRAAVEAREIPLDGTSVSVTVSIGLALSSDVAGSHEDLIKAADQALYAAKREGRNRVRVASGTT